MAAEAVAGSTWQIEIPLVSQSNSHAFQSSPTIASGDWKKTTVTSGGTVSSLSNLDNLPTVDPVGSAQVKIILSAAETTAAGAGGHVNIYGTDASGAEWDPVFIRVEVEALTTNGRASDIQARIPAALVSGRIDSSVGAMAANVLTATAIAADAITDAKVASDVTIASVTGAVGSVTGNVGGNVAGSVGSVTAGVTLATGAVTATAIAANAITSAKIASGAITSAAFAADAINAAALATDAVSEIQSGLATASAVTTVGSNVTTILGQTGTTGVVVASLGTQAKADVNAEVLDVLNVDTFAEPTTAPSATSSLRAKIGWIFKILRNRMTQTSTTQTLYADDGTTADNTSTTSDNGSVFTRGEWS